jgi:hypothetical protein
MSTKALVDNDILIKCACYSLLEDLWSDGSSVDDIGILGAARYVVVNHLMERGKIIDRSSAAASFERFLESVSELEPTEIELALASSIEEEAILADVDLDGGESQLCAVAIIRGDFLVVTGDKRAIRAAERLLDDVQDLAALSAKVVCFEQLIAGIVKRRGSTAARAKICAEPDADKTLAICFGCGHSRSTDSQSVSEGLVSYVHSLRAEAPTLLYPDDAL